MMPENTHGSISHEQAQRYILAAADGLLAERERSDLHHHLRACADCRAEADQLNALQRSLHQAFHERWDATELLGEPLVTQMPAAEPLLPRLGRTTVNLLLLALWCWLYWAVFGYLRIIFSTEEFRTNQFLLILILALILMQFRQLNLRLHLDALPQVYWPGLALALGGSTLYLVVERFLDINTLSATLFGLASYGLIGLWMSPRRWQDGLPAALLLIGTLPFGDHLQTFVGYPMRLATAAIVRDGLHVFGIQSIGIDTILVLESGLAQVDLPCSGIKSLWTGMLFLTAATWIEGRLINGRWLGIAALTGLLLFLANVARVATLVWVDQVAGWKMVAQMLHVPLGVLAFVGVCAAAFLLLRVVATQKTGTGMAKSQGISSPNGSTVVKRPLWLAPLLAVAIAGMALLYTPRPQVAAAQAEVTWLFPMYLQTTPYPLSPGLYAWVTDGGAESAERWHFTWDDGSARLTGSLLYLTSTTWRGQHRPERCFETQGLTVETSQTVMYADDFPVRLVLLSGEPAQVSALYWLQTGNRATDDFAIRIWADLTPERNRWVLVTVLFDQIYPPDDPAVQRLAQDLRQALAASLEGERP